MKDRRMLAYAVPTGRFSGPNRMGPIHQGHRRKRESEREKGHNGFWLLLIDAHILWLYISMASLKSREDLGSPHTRVAEPHQTSGHKQQYKDPYRPTTFPHLAAALPSGRSQW
jgi:hypothetical protein